MSYNISLQTQLCPGEFKTGRNCKFRWAKITRGENNPEYCIYSSFWFPLAEPSKLPVIREASTTSNSINIEWEDLAPEDRMGVITGHLIEYRHASDTQTHTKEVSGAARSYLISGTQPCVNYRRYTIKFLR